jgi:hypothetical protein
VAHEASTGKCLFDHTRLQLPESKEALERHCSSHGIQPVARK